MKLDSIEDGVAAIARGELVVVVDDTDRENEGDLIMAASQATPEKMAFMIRHTSGIICVPMSAERAAELHLPPMVADNRDPLRTAFTVSVDYRVGMTTGIAAEERANTARALANQNAGPQEFLRPGHIFPLIGRSGGVLTRSGHTEAGIDLARLAGLDPVGVLAEVVNDDGTVKRLPALMEFAAEHKLKIVSIEDLIAFRLRHETFVTRAASRELSIAGMPAVVHAYRTPFDAMEHVVAVFGDVEKGEGVPCRIHKEQPVTDLFERTGRVRDWVQVAVERFQAERRGVLIFLRSPLVSDLTEDGDAGEERHSSAVSRMQRWREVGVGAQILRDLDVCSIKVLATSPRDYVGLGGFGIEIADTIIVEN